MNDLAAMEAEVEAAKARMRKTLADGIRAYLEASPEEQRQARLEFWKALVPAGNPLKYKRSICRLGVRIKNIGEYVDAFYPKKDRLPK
jgi:hypothetical protein